MNHSMSMDSMTMEDMMMQMYFYASDTATILFKQWKTATAAEMFGSCLAVFIIAFLLEALKALRHYIQARRHGHSMHFHGDQHSNGQMGIGETNSQGSAMTYGATDKLLGRGNQRHLLDNAHLLQTLLHLLQTLLGYSLMLVVMTYNVYLLLAVCLGTTAGYFAFAWRRTAIEDPNDCCN